jgi:hypothetical protein
MITTMTVVIIVSRPVGQTTFLVSACTWRTNSPGDVRATVQFLAMNFDVLFRTAARPRLMRKKTLADVAKHMR